MAFRVTRRDSSGLRAVYGRQWPRHLVLMLIVGLTLYPLLVMAFAAFKDTAEFERNMWSYPQQVVFWANFLPAWEVVARSILISIVVCFATATLTLMVSSLAAYAFARFSFPGKELLYYMVIVLMMMPWVLTLIPSFVLVARMNMLNTIWVQIIPKVAGAQVAAIFLLRTFFAAIPEDLFEAARLDGASHVQTLWRIVLPLSRAALGTVVLVVVLDRWNDFIWPFITMTQRTDLQPFVVKLYNFRSARQTLWGPLFAAYTLGTLPMVVLFAFTSRYFTRGLTAGAVRG